MFGFEKLEVWQTSQDWCGDVYDLLDHFPDDERFELKSQIRRAATSVHSNIAEGSGRHTANQFRYHIGVAYGSLMETVSQLRFAQKRGYISREQLIPVYKHAEQIARMLSGLRDSLPIED